MKLIRLLKPPRRRGFPYCEWCGKKDWNHSPDETRACWRLEAADLDARGVPLNSFDPYWDVRSILARVDAAIAAGTDPAMAALGGPFYVTGDALEVDLALSAIVSAPTMPNGEPWPTMPEDCDRAARNG